MDPKRKKILSVVGVIAVCIMAYFVYQHMLYVETDNAQIEAHSVMIAAKVSGYVTAVRVDEGQKVKKGDLLVEIDQRDYQNTLTEAKAELNSAQARVKDSEGNFARLSQLYKSAAVSQQQYDAITSAFSEAKAKVESISAQVAQAELNLQNTKILAPSDGFIAKRNVEEGQLASPGIPLVGFVDAGSRWVVANFKETEIEDIKSGAQVEISIDAISKKSYKGHVDNVSSATGATFTLLPPDNSTGNFTKVVQRVPVKIIIDNLSEDDMLPLRAGLSVVVRVRK
jgi:membrane fusion protein (multidrug efflux system)